MDLSVIIPSYKSEGTIGSCLSSILSQKPKASLEVIVVDSSPDDLVDRIVSNHPGTKLIKLHSRVASGVARNIGWEKSKGELSVFLDSDVTVPDGWLDGVFEYYGSGHDVFSVGLKICDEADAGLFDRVEWFFQFSEFKPDMEEGARWCLPSYALMVKREAFERDKFLDWHTAQDTELTVRLNLRGYRLFFNPALSVSHKFRTTPRKMFYKAFIFGRAQMQLRKIHDVSGSYFVRRPALFFLAIPAFAFVKFWKMTSRNLRYNRPGDKLWYVLLSPLLASLLLTWTGGAYANLLSPKQEDMNYPV